MKRKPEKPLKPFTKLLENIAKFRAGADYPPVYPSLRETNLATLKENQVYELCVELTSNAIETQHDIELNNDLQFNLGYRNGMLHAIETIIQYCEQPNQVLTIPDFFTKKPA